MAVLLRHQVRADQRGFTLTEVMAVVAIMGVLATIAIGSFVGHSRASKTGEAMAVVQAIRAAQERYRAENQVYFARDSREWYPTTGVGDKRTTFAQPGNSEYDAMWKELKPTVDKPVGFGYWVDTGLPGDALPVVKTSRKFASGTVNEPWYVVQAQADADGDGTFCRVTASSMNPDVFVEDDGE
jgi:prepilin-type N-terminal cleavage/methylation domain-containing protein